MPATDGTAASIASAYAGEQPRPSDVSYERRCAVAGGHVLFIVPPPIRTRPWPALRLPERYRGTANAIEAALPMPSTSLMLAAAFCTSERA